MVLLFNDKAIQTIVSMIMDLQKRENISLPFLKKQLVETSKKIDNMLNAIQQAVLTSSTKQRLEELEEMKSNLEVSILQEEMEKPFLSEEQITFWLHKFRDSDTEKPEHRQRLIDSFVNAIICMMIKSF